MSLENTRVFYVAVPIGEPSESTFEVRKETIDSTKELPEGHVLVENIFLSVDPYMESITGHDAGDGRV
jgi:NADPH-dependent curcumin reductase CurA